MKLHTPVLTASGAFGYGDEFARLHRFPVDAIGALVLKTVTLEPRTGNPEPRIVETPGGLINSIGLHNVGARNLLAEKLPKLRGFATNVIVSVGGFTVGEYYEVASLLSGSPDYEALEVNISCPNVEREGRNFAHDPVAAASVTRAVKAAGDRPVIVKLSPNAPDIVEVAIACAEAGADALSLVNTYLGLAIDIGRREPVLQMDFGGLSGPAIKPLALAAVARVTGALRVHGYSLPVIGMGGIQSPEDALEFLIAGASAVAIGTASFFDPSVFTRVSKGIAAYLDTRGLTLRELVGSLRYHK